MDAQQLLAKTIIDRNIGLLILSEQYKAPSNYPSWPFSTDSKFSVALTVNGGLIAKEIGSSLGFAWLRTNGILVFSCYWTPNGPTTAERIEEFNWFLDRLEDAIRRLARDNETLLISGDLNAKSTYWGSSITDGKGELLESFAASLRLVTCNTGCKPTFQRGLSSSVIDVTFVGHGSWEISEWTVRDDFTFSDHNYLTYKVKLRHSEPRGVLHNNSVKWA